MDDVNSDQQRTTGTTGAPVAATTVGAPEVRTGGGSIDIATERLIPAAEIPSHLPRTRGGRKVHVSVPYRWMQRGLRGVRLEFLQVGNRRCTSVEALQRFFRQLTDVSGGGNGGGQDNPSARGAVEADPGVQARAVTELRQMLLGGRRGKGGRNG